MLMEMGYFDYTQTVQRQCSIQGFPVNGLLFFTTAEEIEDNTFVTVRGPEGTLVPRVRMDYLHQISDWYGGASADGDNASFFFLDLGLLSLGDAEEMQVIVDCEDDYATASTFGIAAVIDDLPDHDEMVYQYELHTDTSFNAQAAASLFVFRSSLASNAELINIKIGEDVRSTTLRATNWYANVMGKIELDNTEMGVVFDNAYGQPLTVNMSSLGTTSIVKRVFQAAPHRAVKARKRLSRLVARKVNSLDAQTLRAVP